MRLAFAKWASCVALLCALAAADAAGAAITGVDDAGVAFTLERPAARIVSLAPHVTEMLYAIGAGPQLVGAVEFSDFPAEAMKVPRIGGYSTLDVERIRALRPDLVIGWRSGNPTATVEKLRALGVPVYLNETADIAGVATSLRTLGRLSGHETEAARVAEDFESRYHALAAKYSQRAPVRMFYQVWDRPLTTINGKQVISDAMRVCGAVNVFADLPTLAPTVDVEAVLAANPELIATSGQRGAKLAWIEQWRKWPSLLAVQRNNFAVLPPDLLVRMGPRLVDGAEALCAAVEAARARRP